MHSVDTLKGLGLRFWNIHLYATLSQFLNHYQSLVGVNMAEALAEMQNDTAEPVETQAMVWQQGKRHIFIYTQTL